MPREGIKVKLGTRIVLISVGSVLLTAAAGLLIQRSVIEDEGINMTRDTMRAVILGAENTRQSVSKMRSDGIFDDNLLLSELAQTSDYRKSKIYSTVPVVAAWNSISDVAKREGYDFRVPAHHARNPDNAPRGEEETILNTLESSGKEDYFAVDHAAGRIVYARPIRLSADCLACHGDPSQSLKHNGKDVLGFNMEGWKTGDPHGMFLLSSSLDRVNGVVRRGMLQTLYWLLPLALVVGLLVYAIISRISGRLIKLTHSVSDGSSEVTSAAAQIASASQSLAQGASQQAGSIEETSAAAEQITSLTRRNFENSRNVSSEMDEVHKQVAESDRSLAVMIHSMQEINDSSGKIARIIKVIDEISFQTNILALNAAVEAARAGEAGGGFAVVAEEVRSLATRSANAAKETATLIEDSLDKSRTGSEKLQLVVTVFNGISQSAGRVKTLIEEVKLGSEEQSKGIEQVLRSIQQVDKITQESAANAEQTAATSEQLSAQAEAMNQIAQELKVVVEG